MNYYLRNLEKKDAPLMLEWMHDESVVCNLNKNFSDMTINDCLGFIHQSIECEQSIHMAIVDESDDYLGTVSLKNIDYKKKYAEFAITIRKSAMGRGISKVGMFEILRIAFEKINLRQVYWYVSKENIRAIKFYDKLGFRKIGSNELMQYNELKEEEKNSKNIIWYEIKNNEFEHMKTINCVSVI